ncbi:CPBP family glutamic-type intramembrane protease [Pseudotenacibaculum sp. MALMAid0570]|uniref:CPBP family glutamic-type intramembrane protease n=1 Tax=Pseudotenacibaculum sp. MALMAid0570 TaxID=3143938 RepID=UPI0032DE7EA5
MNTLTDLFKFLKNPVLESDPNTNLLYKLKVFIILLITCFTISFFLSIIIGIIYSSGLIENDYHAFDDLKELSNYKIFLIVAVMAPLIEEAIFRAPLVLFKSPLKLYMKPIPFSNWKIVFPTINIRFLENPKVFRIAFYLFSIAFGFIHLFNYQLDTFIILFSPILISPQLVLGLVFGFIRVRLGLPWAILIHSAYNGILVLLFILAKNVVQ